jgi:hypothetical protein
MRDELKAIFGIVDFVIPFEVLSAVGLVFTMENILESFLTTGSVEMMWVYLYFVFVVIIAVFRLVSADEGEIDELVDDITELSD